MDPNNKSLTVKKTAPKKSQPFALVRVLKKHKFHPLSSLINDVYPHLEPKEQASVCLKLIEYLYSKMGPMEPTKRGKKSLIQVNTQVNVPNQPPPKEEPQSLPANPQALIDLLKIASGQTDRNE